MDTLICKQNIHNGRQNVLIFKKARYYCYELDLLQEVLVITVKRIHRINQILKQSMLILSVLPIFNLIGSKT